jgi:putative nucleotidyltransferase with HDIG domain
MLGIRKSYMDRQKIEQFEEEIKNLHYDPEIAKHSFSDFETREFYNTFWDIHIKPVIEYSKQMAEKYGADAEAVWLGAILHDIARLTDEEPHDEVGSEKAYKILLEKGFDKGLAEKVKGIILTHRCRKYPPETLEQKIVASADAMAHFLPPFYLWIGKYNNKSFAETSEKNLKKIERDYDQKIFFEDEKKMVEEQYKILKNWLTYKI